MISVPKAQWIQVAVLIVCFTLTYASVRTVDQIVENRSQENFDVLVDQSLRVLDQRSAEYARTLDGVAGLFQASTNVTADDMFKYGEALGISENPFIVDAIGFAQYEREPSNTENAASATPADERTFVKFIEPNENNASVLGLDFASNAELLNAANTAQETDQMLSARHIPETPSQAQHPQVFLLRPIFRTPDVAAGQTAAQRDFIGFSFMLVNVANGFTQLSAAQGKLIELAVSFAPPTEGTVSNRSAADAPPSSPPASFERSVTYKKFGQSMILSWRSLPQFDALQPFRARWIVLGLGLLVSALISAILQVLIWRERVIRAVVAKKSRDLLTKDKEQRSILENAMLAIISAQTDGEILQTNIAARRLLLPLNKRVNLAGQYLSELIPALNLENPDGWFKLELISPSDPDSTLIIEVQKNTWLTADGDLRVTLLMRDVTANEHHAQELAEAEQRWNLALMGAKIGVFDLDLKGKTSVVSQSWRETLGIGPRDIHNVDDPFGSQIERVHKDDIALLRAAHSDCAEGKTERATCTFRVSFPEGAWRWMQSDAVVVSRASDGTALRMLGTLMDITESFELEQLKHSFVATVSHELRTPLTSIKGALALLQAQWEKPDFNDAERLIRIALSNSDRLVNLVNDILDIEKINAGSMSFAAKAQDLGGIMTLAAEQVETYASQWGVGLDVTLPETKQEIWTDKTRIIQVLTNLLSNAFKFSHPDTKVRLSVDVLDDCAKITVSNLGTGIPQEFQNKVFQPFTQADTSSARQRGGTGLGLNISRQMIKAMGGSIGFDSVPDKETTFWITCPLADSSGNGPKMEYNL